MKKVLNERKYLCRIATSGPIKELGCVTGPIQRCKLNEKVIFQLVKNARIVYEVNPFNPSEEVLLTTKNMATRHFVKPSVNHIKMTPEVVESDVHSIKAKDTVEETVESEIINEEVESPQTEIVEDESETTPVENVVEDTQDQEDAETESDAEEDTAEDTVEETVETEKPQYQIQNNNRNKHSKNKNKNR